MFRTLALVLVLSSSLAAQDPAKQAVAAVKAAAKLAVKDFRTQVLNAYENFETDLKAAEDSYVDQDGDWEDLAESAINQLVVLQIELTHALPIAVQNLFEGPVADAIGAQGFDDPPPDLVLGSGGALDDARDALRAVVDKQLATALKRLKKTAKLLDKQDDVTLLLRAWRPELPDQFIVGPSSPAFQQPGGALVIHTLGAASQRGEEMDGILCVAGWGTAGTVTVHCGVDDADVSDTAEIDGITHTWAVSFENMPELNWALSAQLGDDDSIALASFGIP